MDLSFIFSAIILSDLDRKEAIYLDCRAMSSVLYWAHHAAVMTPLVVESELQRCPVGTTNERQSYLEELRTIGTRPGIDPTTGVASDEDRRRFHRIRGGLRDLGLPLFHQKTVWSRWLDRWDLFWGVKGRPGPDTLLRVPAGDVQSIIATNQASHPFVPDLAVRFLLGKRDSLSPHTRNPFIEAELWRLAVDDPLRLYSRLGTAFYLDILGDCSVEDAGLLVGDMMERGFRGCDGRVIPMVRDIAKFSVDPFTKGQMAILVQLAQQFPVLENEFAKFDNKPELLTAALAACFDDHGKLVVREESVLNIASAFSQRDAELLRGSLCAGLLSSRDNPHWKEYAMARALRQNKDRASALGPLAGEGLPVRLSRYSTAVLFDLMLYFELDVRDAPKAQAVYEAICQRSDFEHVRGPQLGIFSDAGLLANSELTRRLKSLADHESTVDPDFAGRGRSDDMA